MVWETPEGYDYVRWRGASGESLVEVVEMPRIVVPGRSLAGHNLGARPRPGYAVSARSWPARFDYRDDWATFGCGRDHGDILNGLVDVDEVVDSATGGYVAFVRQSMFSAQVKERMSISATMFVISVSA